MLLKLVLGQGIQVLPIYPHFLLGFPFVLRTDHAPLMHLMRTLHPVAQSARYLDTLAEYQFMVQYRPGVLHRNVDVLSKHPCNRDSSSPLCKQCGPLLEPINEGPEGEEADDERESLSYGLGVASARCDRSHWTAAKAGCSSGSLQSEAPAFVPSTGLFDIVEVERGRAVDAVSVKKDGLMGTAEEAGLSAGPL